MEGTTELATHRTSHQRADTTEESRAPEHEHERLIEPENEIHGYFWTKGFYACRAAMNMESSGAGGLVASPAIQHF